MRMLIVLAAIVIGLGAVGVIHFQKNGDSVNISIDKKRLGEETSKVKEIFREAKQTVQQQGK